MKKYVLPHFVRDKNERKLIEESLLLIEFQLKNGVFSPMQRIQKENEKTLKVEKNIMGNHKVFRIILK